MNSGIKIIFTSIWGVDADEVLLEQELEYKTFHRDKTNPDDAPRAPRKDSRSINRFNLVKFELEQFEQIFSDEDLTTKPIFIFYLTIHMAALMQL